MAARGRKPSPIRLKVRGVIQGLEEAGIRYTLEEIVDEVERISGWADVDPQTLVRRHIAYIASQELGSVDGHGARYRVAYRDKLGLAGTWMPLDQATRLDLENRAARQADFLVAAQAEMKITEALLEAMDRHGVNTVTAEVYADVFEREEGVEFIA